MRAQQTQCQSKKKLFTNDKESCWVSKKNYRDKLNIWLKNSQLLFQRVINLWVDRLCW